MSTSAWLHPVADTARPSVIELGGEIDAATVARLQRRLPAVPSSDDVIAELSGVGFCGVAGIRLLLQLHTNLHETGHTLLLAAAPRTVTRPLGLLNLQEVLPSWPTVRAAMATVHQRQAHNDIPARGLQTPPRFLEHA